MSLVLELILLILLIAIAAVTVITKRPLIAVVLFMPFSTILTFIWLILNAPDVAITEAAVGVGIVSCMFILILRKSNSLEDNSDGQ